MARALGCLLLLLFCSCVQSFLWRQTRGATSSKEKLPTEGWFWQKLDHFSKNGSRLWRQRYFLNDAFYKPGGPIFLKISGTLTSNIYHVSVRYSWVTYAERLGALCLLLEHRFYGLSQPTGDLSTASLRYLSSRQALADIVNFQTKVAKKTGLTTNKWVVFGCSYGGFLAVWSRIKYPDLFAAAVGSSTPMLVKINFYEYFEGVQRSLGTQSSECLTAVKETFLQVAEMLKRRKYYSKLKSDLILYSDNRLNSDLEDVYVPYGEGHQFLIRIDELCDIMTNSSLGSPYYRFLRIIHSVLKEEYLPCLATNYNDKLRTFSDSSINVYNPLWERQWFYQCCTEFGFFSTTDSKHQPFTGLPLSYYVQQCTDFFGPEFNYYSLNTGVMSTNMYYHGFNVTGSKIIFSNGSFDPWHTLGITKDISKDLLAVFIKGEGHCSDFNEARDTDSAELIQAREKIFHILQHWLKE
ncbi:putative serine protease K12H4.7 [Trichechus inunguis]